MSAREVNYAPILFGLEKSVPLIEKAALHVAEADLIAGGWYKYGSVSRSGLVANGSAKLSSVI